MEHRESSGTNKPRTRAEEASYRVGAGRFVSGSQRSWRSAHVQMSGHRQPGGRHAGRRALCSHHAAAKRSNPRQDADQVKPDDGAGRLTSSGS